MIEKLLDEKYWKECKSILEEFSKKVELDKIYYDPGPHDPIIRIFDLFINYQVADLHTAFSPSATTGPRQDLITRSKHYFTIDQLAEQFLANLNHPKIINFMAQKQFDADIKEPVISPNTGLKFTKTISPKEEKIYRQNLIEKISKEQNFHVTYLNLIDRERERVDKFYKTYYPESIK